MKLAIFVVQAQAYLVMPTPSTVPLLTGLVNRLLTNIENRLATVQLLYLMGLYKNSIDSQPSTVTKIYFCFQLQYYWRAWDKEKIQSHPAITKINIFSFLSKCSVCLLRGTQKKLTLPPPKKKPFKLHYYCGTWDLEKNESASSLKERQYCYFRSKLVRTQPFLSSKRKHTAPCHPLVQ